MRNIGNLIKTERNKQNMSLRTLATKTGCSYMSIYHWERGEKNISLEMADRVLNELGISVTIGRERNA